MRLLKTARLLLIAAIFSLLTTSQVLAYQKLISVPLNFFIITELSIPKDTYHLTSWIQEGQIRKTVLPEINRIWKQANIEFYDKMILVRSAKNLSKKKEISEYLANAARDEYGKSDPERITKLSELIDFSEETAKTLNIYLVPYLGEASQGHAQRKLRRAFIAQWTDKPSKGELKPERFQLREQGEFKDGSLARTIAHEIGHLLKLSHPEKEEQTVFHRLMGGKQPGYQLTADEVERARRQAIKLTN